jgi:hypothetical protein
MSEFRADWKSMKELGPLERLLLNYSGSQGKLR